MSDETPNLPPGSSGKPPPTPNPEAVREYYREHYVRALEAHKYMGNMRASIAWFPTIIVLTSMTFVAKESHQYEAALGVMWLLLGLIVYANYRYQLDQDKYLRIAAECEKRWREASSGQTQTGSALLSYSDLEEIAEPRISKAPDLATYLLAALLFGIAIGSYLVLHYGAGARKADDASCACGHLTIVAELSAADLSRSPLRYNAEKPSPGKRAMHIASALN